MVQIHHSNHYADGNPALIAEAVATQKENQIMQASLDESMTKEQLQAAQMKVEDWKMRSQIAGGVFAGQYTRKGDFYGTLFGGISKGTQALLQGIKA